MRDIVADLVFLRAQVVKERDEYRELVDEVPASIEARFQQKLDILNNIERYIESITEIHQIEYPKKKRFSLQAGLSSWLQRNGPI